MEKFTLEIEAKLDKATKGVENLTEEITNLKEAQSEQVEGLKKQVKDLSTEQGKATKAVKGLSAGFKGVGLAMKAAGIGLVLALFNKLGEAMMKNQKVADAVETVFAAVGMIFKEVSDRLMDVFATVNEATGGFDALQTVLVNMLKIAFTPIQLAFQGIKAGIVGAQLAWENSWFGDGDPETIKRLEGELNVIKDKVIEISQDVVESGKAIASNIVEAVGEVSSLVTAVVEETANAVQEIDLKTIASNAKALVASKNNYALLEAQSRRLVEQYDLEAEQQRQIRDDVSLSVQERIDANTELADVLKRQSEEEKNGIQARIGALSAQIKLEGKSHDLTAQLYDLNTEMLAIDAKVAGFKSEQLTNETALKQELLDLDKARLQSASDLAVGEANFLAESETNELRKVQLKREAFELEKEIELERLQFNIDNTKEGTQARIDAEAELAAKLQEFGHQKIELDKLEAETKKAMINQGLDMAINAAGAESKIGKALFIAKQALALKELIMNAKNTLSKSTMNAAESGTDIAKGAGKAAASAPPPFNLIPIAMFAAQAVGIISSIRSAMQKSKAAVASAGGGAGGGGGSTSISPPPTATAAEPSFNIVGQGGSSQLAEAIGGQGQQPVQAYVVSNDVTSAQSMERNIVETTSL
tara:strand:+ start:462 stop:2402 length:1941 start_codon:yes stop_codon:yes gene_type:complete